MADIKFAVYKIFNGTDFDTVYFKAPASAITESATQQFISSEYKNLITTYLDDGFNVANGLVKLNSSGKITSSLIDADFQDYLDKRANAGTQTINSQVSITAQGGLVVDSDYMHVLRGIHLNPVGSSGANAYNIKPIEQGIQINLGTDTNNQEIKFTRAGNLEFKKATEIKNVKVGADSSAVPKSYVDILMESGARPIASVKAATTEPLPSIPSAAPLVIDGVTVSVGDRVLIKDQANKTLNGIYEVTGPYQWPRINSESDLKGALVFVEKGNTNNDSKWFYEGDGEWIKFSQTDQLQFSDGLARSGDNVTLASNHITNDHIKSNAGIALSKLGRHQGSINNWTTLSVLNIQSEQNLADRITNLARTIWRIRGGAEADLANGDYGAWDSNSLSIVGVNDIAVAKQNPVRYGTASPSTSLYAKGDVYLLYDQETP